MANRIYDRKNAVFYDDKQYGGKALKFLYETVLGRIILKLFIAGKGYSRLNAFMNSRKSSVKKIAPFIEEYGIDMSDFEDREYTSFNDFFTRKLAENARVFDNEKSSLISVADSKLLCYNIGDDGKIPIKNSVYTAEEIIGETLPDSFNGGYCLVFRLTVDDYHRYCFFDNGKVLSTRYINGKLHTVSPISSKRYKVYVENCRRVTLIDSENFKRAYQIEIGALLVGKIIDHGKNVFKKGEEKGYFEMGGSTCVLMLEKGDVRIDEDILLNSQKGIETKVRIGERIGGKC